MASYVAALEAFDAIPEMQELKALARERGGFAPGKSLLDVGCGFGLETLRLAAAGRRGGLGGRGRQERRLRRRRRAACRRRGAFHRLPDRRRRRPALAGRAVRLRAGGAALDLSRRLGGGGARDAPGREARGRARLHRAGLLDHHGEPARPGGGAAGAGARGGHGGHRELAAGGGAGAASGPRALAESRSPREWRRFRRTSARPISAASAGTPPRRGRCRRRSFEAWLAGIAELHGRGRLFGTVGYFLFTARA